MVRRARLSRLKGTVKPIAAQIEAAVAQHRAGDLDGAAVAYQRILAQDPRNVDALHFFGLLEHQRGRSELGLELMNRAIASRPDHPDFLSNRGNVLKLLGRLEQAEQDYRAVLRLAPNHPNALNNLGTVLRERGEFEEAGALYRRAIALDSTHADAYQNLGNVLGSLNRFEEALDAHREALRLRPNRGDSYRHLAGMYYALGRIDAAADLYRQWLDLEPGHPVPTHMLAACTGVDVPARASNDYVRASFDQFAASFDRALLRLEYRAPQLVTEALSEILDPDSMKLDILDAGCGTGLVADGVRSLARTLVGVDLSPQMIERARSRGSYDELHVSELSEFCWSRSRHYDAIVSADTLVYFGALEEVLGAMANALRPSGYLVFTVEQLETTTDTGGFRIQPHGRYQHSANYVELTLRQAGFRDARLRPKQLRKEAGKWVDGLLVAAHLPSVSGSDTNY